MSKDLLNLKNEQIKFDDIFTEYYPGIYKFIKRTIQDEDSAQDLAQETFLRVFVNIGARPDHNISAWLYTIARNFCNDYWRKKKRVSTDELLDDTLECDAITSKPLTVIEDAERAGQISKVLNLLKSEHRTALILREIEELSYEDAARVMEVSVSAYTSLLNRARNRFIKLILNPCLKIDKDFFSSKEYSVLYRWFGIDAWPENPELEIMYKAKSYFDNSAKLFEKMRDASYPPHLDRLILNKAINKEPKRIGDFGSGTGKFTVKASSSLTLETVYAFDISPNMVDISKQRFNREGFPQIDCLPADLNAIPLMDETLDIGYCLVVLHHLYDPGKAIKEMARTLKPGGQLIIGDFGSHSYNLFTKDNRDLWSGFIPDQLAKWLKEAGLETINVKEEKDCFFKSTTKEGEPIEIPLLIGSAVKKSN
ncbi:MAG: sigma-70 family RNA polymerase sigma factor [Dehalobacterium sp.]|uniref:sigma-70 family RNA polymerase sigma factor n=1 Tax=Desulfitobacterium hafniense TaxID=49338 RepID=UPI000360F0DC|nr:sigma-70 family RNA polymerase sigma factor [Desulfitobacterium hafniense]